MGNELLAYIKGILCYVLFSSLLIQMFPKTKDKKYLELTIGLIFLYLIMKISCIPKRILCISWVQSTEKILICAILFRND